MEKKTLLKFSIILMFATLALFSCDRDDTYIVSFDANGGSGRMQSQLFDAGVPQALTQNAYTRDGYTFSGWNTMQAGNGTAYTNGQTITVTSDMILYAQWTSNSTSGGGQSGSGTHTGGNGVLNGHEYVDLGLPSGTLWATCNVGANSPENYGDYFAWGETAPKDTYTWTNSRFYTKDDYGEHIYKYNTLEGYGQVDNLTTLEAVDDAAAANWGVGWRMPTKEEFDELTHSCTLTWTTQNSVSGYLFTGRNGNSIFLPAAGKRSSELYLAGSWGYYWSSSLYIVYPRYAASLFFYSGGWCPASDYYDHYRYEGLSVRPVCNSDNIGGTANIYVPTVTTGSSSISDNRMTISGNVISDGGTNIISRGFLYGTNSGNPSGNLISGSNGTNNFTAYLTGLTSGTTYYYKAYATNSVGTAYGEVRSFTTGTTSTSYSEPTGYVNGYGYVDLGLPSGTLWATCNVGANRPTTYGNYYAWGETTTKENYTENNYTYTDNPTTLPPSADAATANWGSGWRMPTHTEMDELYTNCTSSWTTQNGVNGRTIIGPNGNSIFLPAGGEWNYNSPIEAGSYGSYWSSSHLIEHYHMWCLYLVSDSYGVKHDDGYIGRSVRPVCNR